MELEGSSFEEAQGRSPGLEIIQALLAALAAIPCKSVMHMEELLQLKKIWIQRKEMFEDQREIFRIRLFDKAAESIDPFFIDARSSASVSQDSSLPRIYTFRKDNVVYKDHEDYKPYKNLEEVDEKSSIAHMERDSGGFGGGKRPGDANIFRNLLNANLPICERLTDVGSTNSRSLRNALKKVWSMQSGGPNIVSNGHGFKNASKLAVGMVLFGNTPVVGAVGAMAPEIAEPGSLQAGDFEKSSTIALMVFGAVGTFVTIIALLKSLNWRRRHLHAGTSAANATAGAIFNGAVHMVQTLTVLRSWRETEYCEVVVAHREEEGAYAS